MSMLQPAKPATPEAAVAGFVMQVRVARAGVVMARVTGAVLVVTVLPPASWTATTGGVAKTVLYTGRVPGNPLASERAIR